MSVSERESGSVVGQADIVSDTTPMDPDGSTGLASAGSADLLAAGLTESLGWLAMLAGTALSAPRASVMFAGTYLLPQNGAARVDGQLSSFEQGLCTDVVRSQDKLIIGDARLDSRVSGHSRPDPAGMLAWAGVPVHDQDDRVMGVLWVADRVARQWRASDITVLETLARLAWSEVSLRAALAHSAGRAALARTLEESLLPPRLPYIPGLQVAARYAAGGTGAEVLGDFCDVFPSANRTWGIVVGDVCGKGPAAAKRTALARYALRAVARRQTRPSLILADLNQVLLDWPTVSPRLVAVLTVNCTAMSGSAVWSPDSMT